MSIGEHTDCDALVCCEGAQDGGVRFVIERAEEQNRLGVPEIHRVGQPLRTHVEHMIVRDVHNVKPERDQIEPELSRRIEAGIAGIAVGRARHDRLLIDKGVIGGGDPIRDIAVDGEKIVLLVGTPAGFRVHVDIRVDEVVPGGDEGDVHTEIRIGQLCRLQRRACLIGQDRSVRQGDPAVGIRCRFPRYA